MILIKPKKRISVPKKDTTMVYNAMEAIDVSVNQMRLTNLQKALNSTFTNINCKGVIYTKNTDKPFFGMCVMPIFNGEDVGKLLVDNDSDINKGYFLELDSKLFDIGLTPGELTAVLLHEVGHVVINMDQSLEDIIDATCMYLSKNRETLDLDNMYEEKDILAFGIKDALRKVSNVFTDEENKADSFAVMMGYGLELESALIKLSRHVIILNKDVKNKLIGLQWSLRLYKDIRHNRITSIKTLNKMIYMTGSELEKKELRRCIRVLKSNDLNAPVISANETAATLLNEKMNLSIFRKFKQKSMRTVEDDLYEYALRIKSCDEQDEALTILRDINSRLAIVDDYLSDKNLDKHEKERWMKVRKRYMELRVELSRKTTYDDKYLGLFVKTPVVKSRYEF